MSEKSYTGLKVQRLKVPAYTVGSFDFSAPTPNYFRVQNRGAGKVFCSTSGYPTEHIYDFSIRGEKAKLYAQPFTANRLYVFNPNGSEVEVVCTSFSADFDPLALSLTELEIEMPDEIASSSVISGFTAPLPTGGNKIGTVDVNNLPDLSTFATLAKQNEILDHLSDVVSHLADLVLDKNKFVDHISAWDGQNVTQDTLLCGNGGLILHMLTNDGGTDFNVVFQGGGSTGTLTLKPGESIGDIRFIGNVSLTGSNYSYRVMCSYPF